jgi:heptosyltransferase I
MWYLPSRMAANTDIPTPRRVLIIKPSALGDVVTAIPVLRGLRRTFGRSVRIDWLLARNCAPLVSEDPDLDGVVEFDRKRLGRMWYSPVAAGAFLALCRRLRKARYDWVIDLQGLFRSGFLARVTGAGVLAGFAAAREFAAMFYNVALPTYGMPTHTVDRNIALAKYLGVDSRPGDYELFVPPAARQWAGQFAADLGRDYLVLAPATRWRTKLYPPQHWRPVIDALSKRVAIVLVAGPGEEHLTAPLAGGANVTDLTGKTSLPQLMGLITSSCGVISCDSAAMNIATALGKPQIALIGPTDPARTGPYRRGETVVQTQLPCRSCLKRSCPHIACMESISPAQVLAAAEEHLLSAGRAIAGERDTTIPAKDQGGPTGPNPRR